jgi:hypothetical protein
MCRDCKNAYMREWRKSHPLLGAARERDNSRSYANVYKRRGVIVPQPCEACGEAKAEMHHQDHERPLEVTWLCTPCHRDWHAFWRETSRAAFQAFLLAGNGLPSTASLKTSEEAA